jgi:hypothetical protein
VSGAFRFSLCEPDHIVANPHRVMILSSQVEGGGVIRLPEKWFIYAAIVALLLLLVGIEVTAGRALWSSTVPGPANPESNRDFDGDYVQGLAERGIVKLPVSVR